MYAFHQMERNFVHWFFRYILPPILGLNSHWYLNLYFKRLAWLNWNHKFCLPVVNNCWNMPSVLSALPGVPKLCMYHPSFWICQKFGQSLYAEFGPALPWFSFLYFSLSLSHSNFLNSVVGKTSILSFIKRVNMQFSGWVLDTECKGNFLRATQGSPKIK